MDNSSIEDVVPKEDRLEEQTPESQSVISMLLIKSEDDCNNPLQVDFPVDPKEDSNVLQSNASTVPVATATSPLNVAHIELTDGGILLESGDVIQSALDGAPNAIQLETAAGFVQGLTVVDEADSCDATAAKFIDGQAVRLEDGTTAFIHSVPRDGLQPVQLEDGTVAYLSQARADLFDGEATGLDLEQLSSAQIHVDGADEKEVAAKMATAASPAKSNQTKSSGGSEKAFPCPYENCDRVYTSPHHLKVHERSHTGDRPFKCSFSNCGKAFATGYGLKSHVRVHTGETPYKCLELGCAKAFKTSGDLQKHLRTHTGERPFKCPFAGCDRAFTTSNIRKVHIRTHTGERPYICDVCGRAFASATNFKNHIRIHTGEKPYTCNVQGCFKKFTEYSSLYKHHVVHTRDKPYVCNSCGKHYRQTSTLAMHERTAHRNATTISKNSVANTKDKYACIKVEKAVGDDVPCLELVAAELTNVPLCESVIENNTCTQHTPVYTIQLQQDGSIGSAQQIIVVTDMAHLTALQQLTQGHVQNVSIMPLQNAEVAKNE